MLGRFELGVRTNASLKIFCYGDNGPVSRSTGLVINVNRVAGILPLRACRAAASCACPF